MITIVNKHQGSNGVYVGRPTVLGNPYTLKVYTRTDAIARYRLWLRQQWQRHGEVRAALLQLARRYHERGELTLACGTPMPISNESALVEPCFCLRRRAYFDGQRGLRPAASHETELESSETIHVRRIQPTLVVVDRTEHEATDLIVPAQDPIRYGEHLAASVATYGPQQHRGPVKEERRVAGEREGCCIQRSKDKRNEHGDVDGCGRARGLLRARSFGGRSPAFRLFGVVAAATLRPILSFPAF